MGSPSTQLVVYTNGDHLTVENLAQITDLSVSEVRVTLYPKSDEWSDNELTSRIKVLSQRTDLVVNQGQFTRGKRGLEMKLSLPGGTLLHVVAPDTSTYSNRAGSVGAFTKRRTACSLLEKSAAIDFEGNVKLCCEIQDVTVLPDYSNLGNLKNETFFEIWRSKTASEIRSSHAIADFSITPICYKCDRRSHD